MKVARGAKLDFIRDLARELAQLDLARELAQLSEADGHWVLAYLFRMAEAEAADAKRSTKKSPIAHSLSE